MLINGQINVERLTQHRLTHSGKINQSGHVASFFTCTRISNSNAAAGSVLLRYWQIDFNDRPLHSGALEMIVLLLFVCRVLTLLAEIVFNIKSISTCADN